MREKGPVEAVALALRVRHVGPRRVNVAKAERASPRPEDEPDRGVARPARLDVDDVDAREPLHG